ncbi:MAG: FKBP-type peptidyl-prolyl cis-trans isomerase [Verrucomicrobiae bacterium]|nr:FKBP-type peptidyl-prolyl cis-trans isomerase [Verrucomicrobiae bacterium]
MNDLTEDQQVYVTMGYAVGGNMMLDAYSEEEVELILEGFRLAAKGEKPDYVDGLRNKAYSLLDEKASEISRHQQEAQITENKAAGEAFMAKIDKKEGVVKTSSGLRYEILKEGSDKYATVADSVNVHYHGTLIDGTVFDSSVERDEPITFPLNGVIAGFREGLTLVGEGGKIRLYMPSDIAYGDRGSGPVIGPGATLIFDVELLKINP